METKQSQIKGINEYNEMMPRQPRRRKGGCGLGWVGSFRISNVNRNSPKAVYSFFSKTYNGIKTPPIPVGRRRTHAPPSAALLLVSVAGTKLNDEVGCPSRLR